MCQSTSSAYREANRSWVRTSARSAESGPEARREVAGDLLLANARAFEDAGDHRKHLARAGRLDQIVLDAPPDRLGHGAVLFRLGHHDDAGVGILPAEDGKHFEAPAPGHLLIEHDQVVVVPAQEHEGIVAVGNRVHVVSPLLQKQQVRSQAVDLVVDPEKALGAGGGK